MTNIRGDGQTPPIGSTVPIAPAVQLTDPSGHPVAGVMVTFSVTAGGGSITGAIQTTDVNGIATVGGWMLGAVPGVNELQAGFNTGVSRGSTIFVATGMLSFVTANAGNGFVCAVTPLRSVYCWGVNGSGELGVSTTETCGLGGGTPCSTKPIAGAGGLTLAIVSAAAGFACGLTPDGAAYCWGDNTYGQLGNGTTTPSTTPVLVGGGGLRFATISAGADLSACGVTTTGAGYCWGANDAGQLGAPSTQTTQICSSGAAAKPCSTTPIAVSGGLNFATVSAGGEFSCGIAGSGGAYCWGDNTFGQLGNGTTTPSAAPLPVTGGLSFAQLSTGQDNVCGVNTSGAAYCWGNNNSDGGGGQLGNGTTTNSATPVAVVGGLSFRQVSLGLGDHTCGVTTSGAAYCWGNNYLGGLGDGTQTSSLSPVAVLGGLTFSVVTPGGLHTAGVTTDHVAYTWGSNGGGQAGIGTSGNTHANTVPVKVAGQP
jgi:alpha-tubulin suppressor-like RCC1 family protein